MKTCPECSELLGDSVMRCFNCNYDYSYGRVINSNEIRKYKEERQKELSKSDEERQKELFELKKLQQQQLANNPRYEYQSVIINDTRSGEIDYESFQNALTLYSQEGWKLHTIFTNEVGKTSTAVMIGFLGGSVNATIDQTVLVFERCIKHGDI